MAFARSLFGLRTLLAGATLAAAFMAPAYATTVTVAQGATGSLNGGLNNILPNGGSVVDMNPPNGAWDSSPTTPVSNWVWDSTKDENDPITRGTPVTFEFSFNLAGYDVSTATLSGKWGVDNFGEAKLNGNTISSLQALLYSNFNPLTSLSVAAGSPFFNAGVNVLTFVVRNATNAEFSAPNPAAFRAALTVTASPVPLPAAAWLFISAIGGLMLVGRRRRMRGATA